jgi:hypothetical protein
MNTSVPTPRKFAFDRKRMSTNEVSSDCDRNAKTSLHGGKVSTPLQRLNLQGVYRVFILQLFSSFARSTPYHL